MIYINFGWYIRKLALYFGQIMYSFWCIDGTQWKGAAESAHMAVLFVSPEKLRFLNCHDAQTDLKHHF
jgi:hypothetical protein